MAQKVAILSYSPGHNMALLTFFFLAPVPNTFRIIDNEKSTKVRCTIITTRSCNALGQSAVRQESQSNRTRHINGSVFLVLVGSVVYVVDKERKNKNVIKKDSMRSGKLG